jgi:hypothetical protein
MLTTAETDQRFCGCQEKLTLEKQICTLYSLPPQNGTGALNQCSTLHGVLRFVALLALERLERTTFLSLALRETSPVIGAFLKTSFQCITSMVGSGAGECMPLSLTSIMCLTFTNVGQK